MAIYMAPTLSWFGSSGLGMVVCTSIHTHVSLHRQRDDYLLLSHGFGSYYRDQDSVKFLGVVWIGKSKITPEIVADKIQAFPIPTTVKQLQKFVGLLGHWSAFFPYLAQIFRPLHHLTKKGMRSQWNEQDKIASTETKQNAQATQAVNVLDRRQCQILPVRVWHACHYRRFWLEQ